ncbi:hypothetical protein PQY04_003421 [Salmonella enterica]|uniref:Uncharacterized protein n=8 Tax=Salmonella enterica TaxID=28901 RepID=A0A5W3M1A7_SALET|nr:hypothetical protein [Salmonella enterica]AXE09136.1 hypothetical protein LFZ12_017220 [Salmonella enterica subsp. enterica serovar Gaminara str. SA20063285]EAA1527911.1 hypothetical protein [Salmonella enterica subsp. enterica serovar Tennessee]EAA3840179.1 hypothetical protein [Salmonella enterica subsp. houtenae]EAA6248472.1 hypothetical protein [Salmonella enterica subsp. salamae]EAA6778015.1 hypothetical protein [Salmonella enterica subsp. enterica serovar Braenderup]EAA9024523.1 hypo
MTIRTQSRTPKYEMTRSDIARYKEREREILTVEGVTRALIEKGIEPQMTLKAFAQRFRNGDLKSVQTDADRGILITTSKGKNYKRCVDMVAYFSGGFMNFFKQK